MEPVQEKDRGGQKEEENIGFGLLQSLFEL
jgi:hypothetical protein